MNDEDLEHYLRDYLQAHTERQNWSFASTSAATRSATKREPKVKPKFKVQKTVDMPSGKVHNITVDDEVIWAYLFSEYKYGEDWFDNGETVLVKEKVLIDLILRYSK